MDTFTGLALSVKADGLHLDNVICLLLQVPQHTGSAGGVHLPDKPLHFAVHSLKELSHHWYRTEVYTVAKMIRTLLLSPAKKWF